MKRNSKKGFTVVELVIVIAIIAILAAVLIPTFSNVIKKANESSDIQAMRNMNTYLAVEDASKGSLTITDVYKTLKAQGLNAKDYKPLYDGRLYFYDQDDNRIVYTDMDYKVLFGENEGKTKAELGHTWFSLSGEIKKVDVTVGDGGVVTLTAANAAEELYGLATNAQKLATVNEIVFPSNAEIDLMGAEACLNIVGSTDAEAPKTFKISGNGARISGIAQTNYKYSNAYGNYMCGLFPMIGNESNDDPNGYARYVKVVVEDLTIENAVIGDLAVGSVGGVAGKVCANSVLICKNVDIVNCEINSKNKVGSFVGQSRENCKIYIDENCSVSGTKINTAQGESGKLIGTCHSGNSGTAEIVFAIPSTAVDCQITLTDYTGYATGEVTVPAEATGVKAAKAGRLFSDSAYINVRKSCTVNGVSYEQLQETNLTIGGTTLAVTEYFVPVTTYTAAASAPTWAN